MENTVQKLNINFKEVAATNIKLKKGDKVGYLDQISVKTFNTNKDSNRTNVEHYSIDLDDKLLLIDLEGNLISVATVSTVTK